MVRARGEIEAMGEYRLAVARRDEAFPGFGTTMVGTRRAMLGGLGAVGNLFGNKDLARGAAAQAAELAERKQKDDDAITLGQEIAKRYPLDVEVKARLARRGIEMPGPDQSVNPARIRDLQRLIAERAGIDVSDLPKASHDKRGSDFRAAAQALETVRAGACYQAEVRALERALALDPDALDEEVRLHLGAHQADREGDRTWVSERFAALDADADLVLRLEAVERVAAEDAVRARGADLGRDRGAQGPEPGRGGLSVADDGGAPGSPG